MMPLSGPREALRFRIESFTAFSSQHSAKPVWFGMV
jgi:hypothetical protein